MKKAFITGVTGQDGSYLAELLLHKGYEVHGMVRRTSTMNRQRIEHLLRADDSHERFQLHYGDLTDGSALHQLLKTIRPDEVYNLAAQSHVRISFDVPEYTGDVCGLGTLRLLDALRDTEVPARFYQASSSEMFGKVRETPQNEQTPFYPRSPYAIAKVFAYWATVNFRESYGMFAVNGILFNHESPRRGENFVTKKITKTLANILAGKESELRLGNLYARRDWGYAKDFVEAMWLMLQQKTPADFVIATGETHTVKEFVEEAATALGISLSWEGSGLEEHGLDTKTGKTLVAIDPRFFRPAEVDLLVGDASKAAKDLGWKPAVTFRELVRLMVKADAEEAGITL